MPREPKRGPRPERPRPNPPPLAGEGKKERLAVRRSLAPQGRKEPARSAEGWGPSAGTDIAAPPAPMTPEEFAAATHVSRETLDRLAAYVELLRDWQTRKNLVSPASLADVWRRHLFDSAQLLPLIDDPEDAEIVDVGSGAGFPGLVLAILGAANVRLVESDQRKCDFLRAAAAATGTAVEIYPERAEILAKSALRGVADVVTARAVAPLPKLLSYAAPILAPGGVCLFLKGARAEEELTAARKSWKMRVTRVPSRSDPSGTILKLEELRRARHGTR